MDPSASPSGRPKRKTANVVSYKEKSEHDIGSQLVLQPPKKQQKVSGSSTKKSTASTTTSGSNTANTTNTSSTSGGSSRKSESKASKNDSANLYIPIDEEYPWNWQPPFRQNVDKFNNVLDLQNAKVDINNVTMTLKDGIVIRKNDFIYMICEPPTEPYYIARVLGFTKKDKTNNSKSIKNYLFNVCWFYRPRDLSRKDKDSRLLYASLHNDECPIQSFRGFVTVKHKSEIEDIDKYRSKPNCFYFDKLYDRYMIKLYEVLPTKKLINLPPNYYKALNKRYEYVFVENGRGSDLLSAPKNCDKCFQWCSTTDSIQCHKCEKYYHLLCLDPPILTKPKRGFGWYCAACNRSMEKELTEKRGKMLESNQLSLLLSKIKEEKGTEGGQEEGAKGEEETTEENGETPAPEDTEENNTDLNSQDSQDPSQTDESKETTPSYHIPKYEEMAINFLESDTKISLEKRRLMEEWPYRYLGMHAKLEDALDLQDRPYARAASRLGAKHQFTNMCDWFDHTVVYYDPNDGSGNSKAKAKGKKGNGNNFKKAANNSSLQDSSVSPSPDEPDLENRKLEIPDEYKEMSVKDFPPWLQKRPKGYLERGTELSATLLWKSPEDLSEELLNDYISQCEIYAKNLNIIPTSPNFVDSILLDLMNSNFNVEEALRKVSTYTRLSLKEPTFSDEEVKRFEESVKKHGSELYPVYKDVETQTSSMVVRFYYLWKKTARGHLIWDNFEGRAKNRLKQSSSNKNKKDDININDSGDDSAYSSTKVSKSNAKLECKHCQTHKSIQWFKAPGGLSAIESETSSTNYSSALCLRCARLWRRYGIEWELPNEVVKKQIQKGGNGWKRKVETELVDDAYRIINSREKYKLKPKKMSQSAIAAAAAAAAAASAAVTNTPSLDEENGTVAEKSRTTTPIPSSGNERKVKLEPKKRSASKNDLTDTSNGKKLKISAPKGKKSTKKENGNASDVDTETEMDIDTETAGNVLENKDSRKRKMNKSLKIKRSQQKENSFTVVIPYSTESAGLVRSKMNAKAKIGERVVFDKVAPEQKQMMKQEQVAVAPLNFDDKCMQRAMDQSRFEQSCHPLSDSRKYSYESTLKLSERFISNYDMVMHTKPNKSNVAFDMTKGQYADSLAEWRFHHSKVHDTGGKSKLLKLPLFSPTKKPCCVCRELDNLSEMIICINCGLNVHASCYGLNLSPDDLLNKAYLKKWCCDPCSNDLHPIATTHYSCCLCSSKESDHDAAIKGESCAFPDALKRTINGRWVHAICSLFSNECQYGNPNTLQPVIGTDVAIYSNLNKLCMVCGVVGGGLSQCRLCDNKFHVTCCQDISGFSIGFEIVPPNGDSDKDKGTIKVKDVGEGRPVPVIVCRNHKQEDIDPSIKFTSLRSLCKRRNSKEEQTVLQFYVREYKKNSLTGGFLLRDNYEKLIKKYAEISGKLSNSVADNANENLEESKRIEAVRCVHCKTAKSLEWYNNDTTCHKCYVRLQINTSVEDIRLPDITRITSKPLDGSKLGINSLDDTLENYNINSKVNGYQPSKVSINNLLS